MIVYTNKELLDIKSHDLLERPAVILSNLENQELALKFMGIEIGANIQDFESKHICFESRNQYDYISILIPSFFNLNMEADSVEFFINKDYLLVLSEGKMIDKWEKTIMSKIDEEILPAQVLSLLFNHILSQDHDYLDNLEDEIEHLEEKVTQKKPKNYTATIIHIRKRILPMKRYFESIYDLLEEMEENQNNIFTKDQLKLFHSNKNKANRLFNNVLSLRDYLTQVREAYQNQLDISLNDTMSFFTVITSIFLPLTLIAGWYGMNLRMPEFAREIAYPVVIAVSLAYVVVSLTYCKKKDGFNL
ncbi:MAG: magnesium transporter [Tissierellia bacterium]|nr:magnesium transporter [Tissierellia bacterium]